MRWSAEALVWAPSEIIAPLAHGKLPALMVLSTVPFFVPSAIKSPFSRGSIKPVPCKDVLTLRETPY